MKFHTKFFMTWKYKQLIILYLPCRLQKDSFVLQVFDHKEEKKYIRFRFIQFMLITCILYSKPYKIADGFCKKGG